uniref:Uncharacterized protein n=1 Tax=Botryococcus braunii TaxID=38881 RepID=A0A0U2F003_BOTBR|nr:hypothetical protein [Botryococcus braunii]AKU37115.1 hypothetical protein [Botryococcus braunii]|eukprot:jgi/Botrbrau1/13566/Bobra.4_2s0024.1
MISFYLPRRLHVTPTVSVIDRIAQWLHLFHSRLSEAGIVRCKSNPYLEDGRGGGRGASSQNTECCSDMEVQKILPAITFNMYARFGEFFERGKTGICLAPDFF